ncbi:MAG: ferredoxin-thioredoxin reductase catalytic domain-containing protein [Methanomassiliicoccales archaeon]
MNEKKRFWRCHVCNDIHYGLRPPEVCPTCGMKNAFVNCNRKEANKVTELSKDKSFLRCNNCGDWHFGAKPLRHCYSCGSDESYSPSAASDFRELNVQMDSYPATPDEVLEVWKDFVQRNGRIRLWEEEDSVRQLANGVLENDVNKGLKYCPCRIPTGDANKDLKLICPCNFLAQQTWKEFGECWCGLFRKR